MTVAERIGNERRIAELEAALEGYMRVVELTDYTVAGDLRDDFLEAYALCLMALPRYKRAAPLKSGTSA